MASRPGTSRGRREEVDLGGCMTVTASRPTSAAAGVRSRTLSSTMSATALAQALAPAAADASTSLAATRRRPGSASSARSAASSAAASTASGARLATRRPPTAPAPAPTTLDGRPIKVNPRTYAQVYGRGKFRPVKTQSSFCDDALFRPSEATLSLHESARAGQAFPTKPATSGPLAKRKPEKAPDSGRCMFDELKKNTLAGRPVADDNPVLGPTKVFSSAPAEPSRSSIKLVPSPKKDTLNLLKMQTAAGGGGGGDGVGPGKRHANRKTQSQKDLLAFNPPKPRPLKVEHRIAPPFGIN